VRTLCHPERKESRDTTPVYAAAYRAPLAKEDAARESRLGMKVLFYAAQRREQLLVAVGFAREDLTLHNLLVNAVVEFVDFLLDFPR